MVLAEIAKPNLTEEEMQYAVKKLGRQPNPVEWAMLEAEWSEHCSYKSSKQLLKLLPAKGPRVLVGPGFDAGVVDVGDGWAVTLHIESHNHPSAIDPYGGAATGVGGVVRDILSLGTRPIALLDPLRFGSLASPHSRWLLDKVVRGIADYGNCIGVPTVGGEVEFDESFEKNCLVDVVCVGLGKGDKLVLAEARNPGDLVYLVGGSTGRDGIRGASFASRVLTEKSGAERSAVQVPDPFTKKLLIEAVLEAVDAGIIRGMKDLGGGGLTCGLSEIAAKGGTGIEIDLDQVKIREPDMNPAEILISESQERMVLVIRQEDENQLTSILEKFELPYSRIGKVTANGLFSVKYHGSKVSEAPAQFIAEAPLVERPTKKPAYIAKLITLPSPPPPDDLNDAILKLLASPNTASREWIYRQYDHEVGIRTVIKPGQGDSAVLRLPNGKSLAVAADGNSKLCYLDPYWGAAAIVSEALGNLVVSGAEPLAVVDHLQFGDPSNPEIYWAFRQAVKGIAEYLGAIGVPCIGGKVSFYNEDTATGRAIKPSPVVAAVGLVEEDTPRISQGFVRNGDSIIMAGFTEAEMGGSEYSEYLYNHTGGQVPRIDFGTERYALNTILRVVRSGLVKAAHDCSKGGLAVALAKMAVIGKRGFVVDLGKVPRYRVNRHDKVMFSETRSRFLFETSRWNTGKVKRRIHWYGERYVPLSSRFNAQKIGRVGGNRLEFRYRGETIVSLRLDEAERVWSQTIPHAMGGLS